MKYVSLLLTSLILFSGCMDLSFSQKPETFLRTCGTLQTHHHTDEKYDIVFGCMTDRALQCIPSKYELKDTFEFRILGTDETGEHCRFEQEYFDLATMESGDVADRLHEYAGLAKSCEMPAKTVKTFEILKPEDSPKTVIFNNLFFELATGIAKYCEGDLADKMIQQQ